MCECVCILYCESLKSNHSRITAIKNRLHTQCVARDKTCRSFFRRKIQMQFFKQSCFFLFEANEFISNYRQNELKMAISTIREKKTESNATKNEVAVLVNTHLIEADGIWVTLSIW